jgi:hypothetical protein
MWIKKCIYYVFKKIQFHKICLLFEELQIFIFPNMSSMNLFIYFYDVLKMVIIHKKIATFGYR